jgi:hypothetical protein
VLLGDGAVCVLGPDVRTLPALRADAITAGGGTTCVLSFGHAAVALQYARLGDVAALRQCLGAVLAARDARGRSSLHCAATDNRADMTRLLLEHTPQLLPVQDRCVARGRIA